MSICFKRNTLLSLAITSASAVGLLGASARGATISSWTGNTSTAWSVAGNWNTQPADNLTDNDALFNLSSYTLSPTHGQPNVDLSTAIAGVQIQGAGALTIGATAGQSLSIGGDGIGMSGSAGAASINAPIVLGTDQIWTDSAATTLTFGGATITGGGSTNLTLVNSGSGTAGLSASTPTITGLGNLTVTNSSTGTGAVSVGNVNGSGTLLINGTGTTLSTVALGGIIGGFTALSVNTSSTTATTISGSAANTFTGTTEVHSGTLTLNKTALLGNGGGALLGNLIIDSGAKVTESAIEQIDNSASVTVNTGGTLTVGGAAYETVASLTNSGTVSGKFIAGTLTFDNGAVNGSSVFKTGAGGLVVSGAVFTSGTTQNIILYLNGDVSYINPVAGGSVLGASSGNPLFLDGSRIFNIASGGGNTGLTADLTISAGLTMVDGTAPSSLTKTGPGILKIVAGNSNLFNAPNNQNNFNTGNSYTGGTTIASGTLLLGSNDALPFAGTVTFGANGSAGTLDLGGFAAQVSSLAVDPLSTGTNTITNSGASAVTLTVDAQFGSSSFGGVIQNGVPAAGIALTKLGANTLTLSGVNSYSGLTTINRGTLEYVGQTTGSMQTLGKLTFGLGEGVVQSTYNAGGSNTQITTLNFSTLARTAGATENFVVSGGTSSTNMINLTAQGVGFISQGAFFNGGDYAYMDAADTFVRAPRYGTDTGFAAADAGGPLTAASNNLVTASITGQGTAAVNTIKFSGSSAVDLNLTGVLTLTGGGLLRTGGSSTIISGVGQSVSSAVEQVYRTDTAGDSITLNVPVVSTVVATGAALTKSGAGTLTLTQTSSYAGKTSLDAGTLVVTNTQALGASTAPLQLNGGTLDLQADSGTLTAYNVTVASNATILSDRSSSNGGINYALGTLSFGGGNNVITLGSGANVTDSAASLSFGAITLGSDSNPTINNLMTQPVTVASLTISLNMFSVTGTGSNMVVISGATTIVNSTGIGIIFNPTTANLSLNTVTTTTGGTLVLDGTSTGNVVNGVISNSSGGVALGVIKADSSTWTLLGTNSYTGPTTIKGGTLAVAGSISAGSAVTLGGLTTQNPTLAGTGSVLGTVTATGGNPIFGPGHISAGTSGAGKLTIQTLTLALGSGLPLASEGPVLNFTFGMPGVMGTTLGTNTNIAVNGALSLAGNQNITLDAGIANLDGAGAYQLMTYGTAAGSFTAATSNLTGLFSFTGFSAYTGPLTVTNLGAGTGPTAGIWLNFDGTVSSSVPEPMSLGLLGLGAAGLLLRRRRFV